MHPFCGALALPLMHVRLHVVPRSLDRRYYSSSPRSRTSQYRITFILHSLSLWKNLKNPVFDSVELHDRFESWANASLLAKALYYVCVFYNFFSRFLLWAFFGARSSN